MATWNGIQIVAGLPRLWSASEFARQNPSGVYLHATCVETSAMDLMVAMDPRFNPDPAQVGNILQAMVNEWRADNPGVSAGGASSYADAAAWFGDQGFTVDANVDSTGWWAEINTGLRAGMGYLVGTCNAAALPGDEPGVQCHGYSAQAVLSDGRLLCGDPDNAASQVLMPNNPVGNLVAYTQADMARAGVTSLTRVHPMSVATPYDAYFIISSDRLTYELKSDPALTMSGDELQFWLSLGGAPALPKGPVNWGLQPLTGIPHLGVREYERSFMVWDPEGKFDSPPQKSATGQFYLAHLDDPRILKVFGIGQPSQPVNVAAILADAKAILSTTADIIAKIPAA